jgi:hypothetical protein
VKFAPYFDVKWTIAMIAASMNLLLLIILAAIVVAVIVFLLAKRQAHGGGFSTPIKWMLALAGLALFVFVGAAILNTITDRKASPDETMPWLVLIGLAAKTMWIAIQKGFFTRKSGRTDAAIPQNDKTTKSRAPRPQPPAAAAASPSILISYRRADSGDVAGRIYDRLVAYYSRETVFKDVDSIPLGIDFRKHLTESVEACQVLLAVIGRTWIESRGSERRLDDPRDFVRIEIETALERSIPIVPLLVQGAAMPNEEDLPPSLRPLAYYNAISIRPDPDFHQDMTRLIKGIEAHLQVKK